MANEETSYFEPLPINIEAAHVTQLQNATTHFAVGEPFSTDELKEIFNREASITPRELYSVFPYKQVNSMVCLSTKREGREVNRTRIADPRNPLRIQKRVDDTGHGTLSLDPMCTRCHFNESGTVGCDINDAANKLYTQALREKRSP